MGRVQHFLAGMRRTNDNESGYASGQGITICKYCGTGEQESYAGRPPVSPLIGLPHPYSHPQMREQVRRDVAQYGRLKKGPSSRAVWPEG